ncbi:MAG: hypothetical protein CMB83_01370 [Flammeovirgaceae bacterium]|nr:hypothetical protein [Flammeovirgaceae bacterium]
MTILKKILSILVSCFFIFLCLKDIPLDNLFNNIKFNFPLLLIAILLLFLINIVKAYRLKILLKNYKKKKFNFYLKPILFRQFLNTTLIGNVGELVVPFFLKKYFKCSYFEGLSIVISERFIDITVISLIFGISLLFNNLNLDKQIFFIYFGLYIFLIIFFLFLVNFKKSIIIIPQKIIKNLRLGYKYSVKNLDILWISFFLSFLIWSIFIIIDLLIFKSFEVTNGISSLPNIIFLTGIILLSQLIPGAPASIGIFNYFVIETIKAFYMVQGLNYDLTVQTQLTSISIIVLLIFILPHITWGGYVFYKEAVFSIEKIKDYSKRYMK